MHKQALLHSSVICLLLMLLLAEISAQNPDKPLSKGPDGTEVGAAKESAANNQDFGNDKVDLRKDVTSNSPQQSETGVPAGKGSAASSARKKTLFGKNVQSNDPRQRGAGTRSGTGLGASSARKKTLFANPVVSNPQPTNNGFTSGYYNQNPSGVPPYSGSGYPQYQQGPQKPYQGYNGYSNYGGGYGNDDGSYEDNSYGIDPNRYGQDFDFGRVRDKKVSMAASMDVFITALPDWEGPGQSGYNNQYGDSSYYDGNTNNYPDTNYDQNMNYQNDKSYNGGGYNEKSNYRKKRAYSKVRFPIQQFKNYRDFPMERFPPLISIFPWLPIFYDKITYQTFIFSPTGGIYIIPPLINFYGQRFAVAQLIKWGYASLVSTGAPPEPGVNIAPFVQPAPVGAPLTAGVVGTGGTAPAPAPVYNPQKASYDGGVKTDFPKFKPRYTQTIEEGGNRAYGSAPKNNYGPDSSYGGTGQQQIYAQGGNRAAPPSDRN